MKKIIFMLLATLLPLQIWALNAEEHPFKFGEEECIWRLSDLGEVPTDRYKCGEKIFLTVQYFSDEQMKEAFAKKEEMLQAFRKKTGWDLQGKDLTVVRDPDGVRILDKEAESEKNVKENDERAKKQEVFLIQGHIDTERGCLLFIDNVIITLAVGKPYNPQEEEKELNLLLGLDYPKQSHI